MEKSTGGAAGLAIVQESEREVGKTGFGTVGFNLISPVIHQKEYFQKAARAQGGDLPPQQRDAIDVHERLGQAAETCA